MIDTSSLGIVSAGLLANPPKLFYLLYFKFRNGKFILSLLDIKKIKLSIVSGFSPMSS